MSARFVTPDVGLILEEEKSWGWMGITVLAIVILGGGTLLVLWATGVLTPKPTPSPPPPSPAPEGSRHIGTVEPVSNMPLPGDAELYLGSDGSYRVLRSKTLQEQINDPDTPGYRCLYTAQRPLQVGDSFTPQSCGTYVPPTGGIPSVGTIIPTGRFVVKTLF